jgi:hypothetical protein
MGGRKIILNLHINSVIVFANVSHHNVLLQREKTEQMTEYKTLEITMHTLIKFHKPRITNILLMKFSRIMATLSFVYLTTKI